MSLFVVLYCTSLNCVASFIVYKAQMLLGDGRSAARCMHRELNEDERSNEYLSYKSKSYPKLANLIIYDQMMGYAPYMVNFR